MSSSNESIPILLLKSPSPTPATDPYTTHLTNTTTTTTTTSNHTHTYTPHFVPVLSHSLLPDDLIKLILAHLDSKAADGPSKPFQYGALIFTSQRAVAAFASALKAPPMQRLKDRFSQLEVRFYTVGPATASSLRPIVDDLLPRCSKYGGESAGSGEVLARLMLGIDGGEKEGEGKYDVRAEDGKGMKSVLFLTGEKRRDVIPRMLMSPNLPDDERIQVDEMVIYQTSELEGFEFHFAQVLNQTRPDGQGQGFRWIVVFSPTAGKGMLKALGWLDERTGRAKGNLGERTTFVVCIGPTTREYLQKEFGFEADVVAEKPSPQGIKDRIERFMKRKGI
ncbi:hypothetical protein OEA41_006638 [Lepraria neglecta]|uniref:Tetrapyrrole biosynthesis uroporphyrinogen III synthase domain-containing protein n=1 Tax=Lepraria neglecta TaxID=209136 RepID=A0AAD9Z822_9LECA|nr:hypothetical protein OEA41_006638 [Lepraria neglecta]